MKIQRQNMKKILLILSLLIGLNSFAQDDFFWSYSHPRNLYDTIKIEAINQDSPNYYMYANIYTYSGDSVLFQRRYGNNIISTVNVKTSPGFHPETYIVDRLSNAILANGEIGYIISKRNDLKEVCFSQIRLVDVNQARRLLIIRLDNECELLSSTAINSNQILEKIYFIGTYVQPTFDLSSNNSIKYLLLKQFVSNPIGGCTTVTLPIEDASLYEIELFNLNSITFGNLNPNIHSFISYAGTIVQSEVDKILKYFVDSNRIPNDLGTSGNDEIRLCGNNISMPSTIGLGYISILISRGWIVCNNIPPTNPPSVLTLSATMISTNSATLNGSVTGDSGSPVSDRGLCWSTSINPTVSNSHISSGSGIGGFSINATSLTANTLYHVRAYAYNSYGLGYGEDVTFTTTSAAQEFPQITTVSPTEIRTTTATSGGIITYDGNYPIIEKGVCWSTSPSPNTSNSHTTDGTGKAAFTSNITGLSPNTTYYLRAYAQNRRDAGGLYVYATGYGQEEVFTTASSSECSLPTITTNSANTITTNAASGGGNVTSDGGCEVTAKGLCWSTSMNPTTANSHTTDGSGVGAFSSSITGLTFGTTYYVRAYATNSSGTAYGNQVSFTTLCVAPTISLAAISGITSTTANTALTITNTGGCTVLVSSIQWSVNSDFTGSVSSGPNTTGSYTITGLSPNTTYYVRGYAANNTGDAYTTTQSFTTSSGGCVAPTLATTTATSITTTTATGGGNVTSDGGCLVTARGVQWSLYSNFSTILGSTTDGSGVGAFSSSITGLTCGTTYYARAYATNSSGTAYGNQVSFTTPSCPPETIDPCLLSVGDSYGGGKIAYFFQSGDNGYVSGQCHGIIAAESDLYDSDYGSYYSWALESLIYCGATGSAIGTGELNTELIYNHYSSYIHTAAVMCYNLTLNGYSDWILGSRFDMFAIWSNKALVGGFSDAYYWTSTEDGTNNAVSIYMGNSSIDSKNKYNSILVRAIRYF